MVELTINVLQLVYNVQFYSTRYLILTRCRSSCDKLKILLYMSALCVFKCIICEGKSHNTHMYRNIERLLAMEQCLE